jgi:hypothetical protein
MIAYLILYDHYLKSNYLVSNQRSEVRYNIPHLLLWYDACPILFMCGTISSSCTSLDVLAPVLKFTADVVLVRLRFLLWSEMQTFDSVQSESSTVFSACWNKFLPFILCSDIGTVNIKKEGNKSLFTNERFKNFKLEGKEKNKKEHIYIFMWIEQPKVKTF